MAQDVTPDEIPNRPLSKAKARALTEQIRDGLTASWELIELAHSGRVWEPLGYTSFKGWLDAEFGISEVHAYRLLDQAHVIRELEAAAGTTVPVSVRQAGAIKGQIEEVAETLAATVAPLPQEARPAAAKAAVRAAATNTRVSTPRPPRRPPKVIEAAAEEVPNPTLDLPPAPETAPAQPSRPEPPAIAPGWSRAIRKTVQELPSNSVDAVAAVIELAEARDLSNWAARLERAAVRQAAATKVGGRTGGKAAAAAPPAVQAGCPHPKAERNVLGHGTYCKRCGKKVS